MKIKGKHIFIGTDSIKIEEWYTYNIQKKYIQYIFNPTIHNYTYAE